MPRFEETSFIESKVDEPKDTSKKSMLSFKFQNSSKVKTVLQGSAAKAFSNVEKPSLVKKNKLILFDANESKESSEKSELFYNEPSWSGCPKDVYKIEVLKSGVILNILNLSCKNYHIIGNSLSCDICLSHESISKFHAVLQYRNITDSGNEKGLYIYDLNSENGTFLNGNRLEPNTYIFLRSGYIISFGDSPKKYVLQTPKDNEEKEAELSATELQDLKNLESEEKIRLEEQRLLKETQERLIKEKDYINWGIADDESTTMTDNTENSEENNDDLFLENPQKALNDWFKWEGHDLEYQTEDRGFGRFSCYIDIPVDTMGTLERVEVHVVGDKIKAVDACNLEACKFLSKTGFLKKAREEKESITRDWKAVDYYDSDDDNFLDRTGIIERKRQQRMQLDGNSSIQSELHNSLMDRYSTIIERIKHLEKLISEQKPEHDDVEDLEKDALDVFMSKLNTSTLNKSEIRDMKMELHNLYQQKILLNKSINVNSLDKCDNL